MLTGGRFKKGVELSTNGTVEISLAQDDGESVATLCSIIHLQQDELPDCLEVSPLRDITRVADKYSLLAVTKGTIQCWVYELLDDAPDHDRKSLLFVAVELGTARLFEDISKQIVLKNIGSISAPWYEDLPAGLAGVSIFGIFAGPLARAYSLLTSLATMEAERLKALRSISSCLVSRILKAADWRSDPPKYCQPTGNYTGRHLKAVLHHLPATCIWPLASIETSALDHIIRRLTIGAQETMELDLISKCDGDCLGNRIESTSTFNEICRKKAKRVKKSIGPLCFECVRAGKAFDSECSAYCQSCPPVGVAEGPA